MRQTCRQFLPTKQREFLRRFPTEKIFFLFVNCVTINYRPGLSVLKNRSELDNQVIAGHKLLISSTQPDERLRKGVGLGPLLALHLPMETTPTDLSMLDSITLLLYFVILLAVAFVSSRGSSSSSDAFFLAGKSVCWYVVGCSLFASNIGPEHQV
mgnify:CR=1 FL=1